jgi:hypothetical protein
MINLEVHHRFVLALEMSVTGLVQRRGEFQALTLTARNGAQ